MKRQTIPFRELLQRVLPVDRLPPVDQARVARAVESNDPRDLEEVGFEALDRLVDLGYLRLVEEVLRGDEKVRRYRDLTSGNTIAIRLPTGDEDAFQGTGTYRIQPTLIASRVIAERFEPILNLGFDINTDHGDRSSFHWAAGSNALGTRL